MLINFLLTIKMVPQFLSGGRSVLELGQFEACPAVSRGRSWLRGRRVGRGSRASSLPAELPLDVVSFGAASLESIVAELQGKD